MATCKDCIHFDVCRHKEANITNITKVKDLIADDFKCFKDKADFVQVVRCKDCKWYNIFRLECYKPYRNGVSWIDDFCSYGERSKDNAK